MRIGHLTDLHLDGSAERAGRLARALETARVWRCDHLCLTGDLTARGDDASLSQLGEVLRASGWSPLAVTVVSGNHDGVDEDWAATVGRLEALRPLGWRASVTLRDLVHPSAPNVYVLPLDTRMRRQPLALRARGRAGAEQLRRVRVLGALAAQKRAPLVVVMHHGPQVSPLQALDGLTDKEAFLAALEHAPTATVLAGHDHRCLDLPLGGAAGRLFVAPAVVDTDDPLRVFEVRGTRLMSVKACSAGRYLRLEA